MSWRLPSRPIKGNRGRKDTSNPVAQMMASTLRMRPESISIPSETNCFIIPGTTSTLGFVRASRYPGAGVILLHPRGCVGISSLQSFSLPPNFAVMYSVTIPRTIFCTGPSLSIWSFDVSGQLRSWFSSPFFSSYFYRLLSTLFPLVPAVKQGVWSTYDWKTTVHLPLDTLHKVAIKFGVGFELLDGCLRKVFFIVELNLAEDVFDLVREYHSLQPRRNHPSRRPNNVV
ncbi:hypothetical protein VTK73DRAFT_9488 [Phialemonium thermophilum]|uniref:Uncharacterized protein n=1 Tax=Phialemonium thermophilum TaxID=223376 RepID=A0ABR3Y5B1_9PEZI